MTQSNHISASERHSAHTARLAPGAGRSPGKRRRLGAATGRPRLLLG